MSEVSLYHHRDGDGDDQSSELDLALGLTLACGGGGDKTAGRSSSSSSSSAVGGVVQQQYARILTAKDLPLPSSRVSSSCGLLSSSSSSTLSLTSTSSCSAPSSEQSKGAGTKRSADSLVTTANVSQAVGWPPVAAYRITTFVNQTKSLSSVEFNSQKSKNNNPSLIENPKFGSEKKKGDCMESENQWISTLVKVSMDGFPYGRKVDLNAHSCYKALSQTLEEMFCNSHTGDSIRASGDNCSAIANARRTLKLLDGSSEFVLTYEDKDGDLMLVGDVPWRMFRNSVKRLRIMRASEANGLAPSKK